MTFRPLYIGLVLALCAFGGWDSYAQGRDKASAKAPDWTVDPGRSSVAITGTEGKTPFSGTVGQWQGTIFFDPKSLDTSHVSVTVDVGSIKTGDASRDTVLPTAGWLAAKAFPTATFESNKLVSLGGDAYEALGTVTIRGVRRSVVLPFTVDMDGQTARARGTLSLMRTDFGVGEGVLGAQPNISIELGVVFDLTATR
jgi:polyisoprenoid-binding protein YceI